MDVPKKPANSGRSDSLIAAELIEKAYDKAVAKIAASPRAFDYAAFIHELRPLIQQAQGFPPEATRVDSPLFKRWRHEVTDLINRIQRLRYSINCRVGDRLFTLAFNGSTPFAEQRKKFEEDLIDTLAELDVLVKNFDKYGDPKASAKPVVDITKQPAPPKVELAIAEKTQNATDAGAEVAELKWPEKMTAAWLWKHMPLGGYAVLSGTFLAGVTVGNWEPIKQLFLLVVKQFGG